MAAVLTSWKEIAAHLGKSIRTVQRWERELNLPVRRPDARRSGIVLADPAELDAWLHQQSTLGPLPANGNGHANGVRAADVETLNRGFQRVTSLYMRSNDAVLRTHQIYEQLHESVKRLRIALASSRQLSASTRQLAGRTPPAIEGPSSPSGLQRLTESVERLCDVEAARQEPPAKARSTARGDAHKADKARTTASATALQ